MFKIVEVRGKYLLMIDGMLSEYNPEVAEEARKELDLSISDISKDGWYDYQILRNYLSKVNDEAQRVLGKKAVYAAGEQFDKLAAMFEKPADLIKFTIEHDDQENIRKENKFKDEVLDSGEDFVKLRLDTNYMPLWYEGIYQGVLERYRIIRTYIRTTIEEENDYQQISVMEIKWQ